MGERLSALHPLYVTGGMGLQLRRLCLLIISSVIAVVGRQ